MVCHTEIDSFPFLFSTSARSLALVKQTRNQLKASSAGNPMYIYARVDKEKRERERVSRLNSHPNQILMPKQILINGIVSCQAVSRSASRS